MYYRILLGFFLTAYISLSLVTNAHAQHPTFTVNSNLSTLKAGGTYLGFDFSAQSSGSDITKYNGTITASIRGDSIRIISADLKALNKGEYYPGANGISYTTKAPAQYGFLTDLSLGPPGYEAIRGLKLNLNQLTYQNISTATGKFNTTGMTISALTGYVDINFGFLDIADHIILNGSLGINATTSGTITTNGTTQTIKIPVKTTLIYNVFDNLTLEGEIIASRVIDIDLSISK